MFGAKYVKDGPDAMLQVADTGGGTELRCGHKALDPDDADDDGQLGLAASRS